jgi:aryl-alcohol dehydrogenase-like predicted oxidoreductase
MRLLSFMRLNRLGKSELEISPIGFGAWAAGGGEWAFALGPQDDAESISAIRRAVELGINWIDTAPLYGLGHSEEVVARAISDLPAKPYVFTKCGMPWDERGRITHSLKRESIRRECEQSLRRLDVDAIDLYQIHWNKPATDVREALEAVKELQDEGKIRYIGVSNFTRTEIELAVQIADPVCLQPPYSLIDREIETNILPYCRPNNIGVIVYSPMQSGLLSGRMTRERVEAFPHDDLRRQKAEFQEPQLSRNLELAERLKKVGERHDSSAAEIAVAWTLQHPAVTAAIVGMRRPEDAEGIVRAGDIKLTEEDMGELLAP